MINVHYYYYSYILHIYREHALSLSPQFVTNAVVSDRRFTCLLQLEVDACVVIYLRGKENTTTEQKDNFKLRLLPSAPQPDQ